MSDEYKIIKTVELSQNINGQNIKAEFDKIDDNFERLTGASITRGQDGVTRTHTFKFDGNGNCANEDEFKIWLTTKLGFPEDRAVGIITSIINAFKNYESNDEWYFNGSYEIYINDNGVVKEALPIIYSNGTDDKKSLTYLQFIYEGKTLILKELNVVLQISEDGYWIVNGVTTSIKAQGEPGKDGKDGPGLDFGFVEVDSEQYPFESIRESLESQLLIKINNQEGYFDNDKKQFISVPNSNFHELNAINIDGEWEPWVTYKNKSNWYNAHKDDIFDVIFEENGQLIYGKGKVELFNGIISMGSVIIGIYCNKIINCVENFHELTRVVDSNGDWVTWSMLSENKQNEWYNINKGRVFLTTNVKPNIEKTYMGYISKIKSFEVYGIYLTESNIYSPGIGYNDVQGFFDNINYASTNQGTPKGLWLRQPNERSGAVFFGNSGGGDDRANNLQIFAIDDYNKVCNSGLFNDSDKRDVNVNIIGSFNISDQIKLGTVLKIDNSSFIFGNMGSLKTDPRIGIYKNTTGGTIAPGIINGERYLQVQGWSGRTTIAPSQIDTTNATIGSLRVSNEIIVENGSITTGSLNVSNGAYVYKGLKVSSKLPDEDYTLYVDGFSYISNNLDVIGSITTNDSLNIKTELNIGGKDNEAIFLRVNNKGFIFGNLGNDGTVPRVGIYKYDMAYWSSDTTVPPGVINGERYLQVQGNSGTTTIAPSQITTNKVKISGNLDCSTITINETTFAPITHNSPLDLNLDYARILYDSLNKLNILKKNGNNISISNGHYINNCCDLIIGSIKTIYYKYNAPTDIEHGPTIDLSNDSLTDFNACILYRVCGKIILGTNKTSDSTYYISVYDDTIEIDDFITIIPTTNSSTITHYLIAPYGIQKGTLDTLYNIDFHNRGNINIKTKYNTLDSLTDATSSSVDFDVQRIRSFIKLLYNVDIVHGFSME